MSLPDTDASLLSDGKYHDIHGFRTRYMTKELLEKCTEGGVVDVKTPAKEKVRRMENLEGLGEVVVFRCQHQKISKVEGVEGISGVEVLSLRGNLIEKIELPTLQRLVSLDFSKNPVEEIPVTLHKHAPLLKELNLSDCDIKNLTKIQPIRHCRNLESLDLSKNPVATSAHYRSYIIWAVPTLKYLDGVDVTTQEREDAATRWQREELTDRDRNIKNLEGKLSKAGVDTDTLQTAFEVKSLELETSRHAVEARDKKISSQEAEIDRLTALSEEKSNDINTITIDLILVKGVLGELLLELDTWDYISHQSSTLQETIERAASATASAMSHQRSGASSTVLVQKISQLEDSVTHHQQRSTNLASELSEARKSERHLKEKLEEEKFQPTMVVTPDDGVTAARLHELETLLQTVKIEKTNEADSMRREADATTERLFVFTEKTAELEALLESSNQTYQAEVSALEREVTSLRDQVVEANAAADEMRSHYSNAIGREGVAAAGEAEATIARLEVDIDALRRDKTAHIAAAQQLVDQTERVQTMEAIVGEKDKELTTLKREIAILETANTDHLNESGFTSFKPVREEDVGRELDWDGATDGPPTPAFIYSPEVKRLGKRISDLESQVQAKQRELTSLQQLNDSNGLTIVALEDELRTLKEDGDLRTKLTEANKTITSLEGELRQLHTAAAPPSPPMQADGYMQQIKDANEAIMNLESENDRLAEEEAARRAEIKQLEAKVTHLTQERDTLSLAASKADTHPTHAVEFTETTETTHESAAHYFRNSRASVQSARRLSTVQDRVSSLEEAVTSKEDLITQLQDELSRSESTASILKVQNDRLEAEIATHRAVGDDADVDTSTNDVRAEHKALAQAVEDLEQDVAQLHADNKELEASNVALQKHSDGDARKARDLAQRVGELEEEVTQLQAGNEQLEEVGRDLPKDTAVTADLEGELQEAEATVAQLREEVSRGTKRVVNAEEMLRTAEEEVGRLRGDTTRLEDRLQAAEEEVGLLRGDNTRLDDRMQAAEEMSQQLEEQVRLKEEIIDTGNQRLAMVEESRGSTATRHAHRVEELEAELVTATHTISCLETELATFAMRVQEAETSLRHQASTDTDSVTRSPSSLPIAVPVQMLEAQLAATTQRAEDAEALSRFKDREIAGLEASLQRRSPASRPTEHVMHLEEQVTAKNRKIAELQAMLDRAARRGSQSPGHVEREALLERVRQLEDQLDIKDDIVENANQRAAEAETMLAEVQGRSTAEIAELRKQVIQFQKTDQRDMNRSAVVGEMEQEIRRLTSLNNELLGEENDTIKELRERVDEALRARTEAEKGCALAELESRQKDTKIELLTQKLALRPTPPPSPSSQSLELSVTNTEHQTKLRAVHAEADTVRDELRAEMIRHEETASRLRTAEAEITAAQRLLEQHADTVAALRGEIEELQDGNALLRKQLNSFRVSVNDGASAKRLAEAEGRVSELEEELATALAKAECLEKEQRQCPPSGMIPAPVKPTPYQDFKVVQAEMDAAHLRGKLYEATAVLESATEHNAKLTDVMARAAASELEMARLNDLVASLEIEKASLVGELKHYKLQASKVRDLTSENSKLKAEMDELKSDKGMQEVVHGRAAKDVSALKTAVKSLKGELATVAQELDAVKLAKADVEQCLRMTEANLEKANAHVLEAQGEVRVLMLEKIDLESEVGSLKRRVAALEAEASSIRVQYQAEQCTIDSLHTAAAHDSQAAATSINGLERDCAALRQKVTTLERQVVSADSEIARLRKELHATKAGLDRASSEQASVDAQYIDTRSQFEKDKAALRQKNSTLEHQLAGAELEVSQLQKSLQATKDTFKAAAARHETENTSLDTLHSETLKELEREKAGLKYKNLSLEQLLAAAEGELSVLREQAVSGDVKLRNSILEQKLMKAEGEADTLRAEVEMLKQQQQQQQRGEAIDMEALRRVEKEKSNLRIKNMSLEQQLASVEGEVEALKNEVQKQSEEVDAAALKRVEKEKSNLRIKNTSLEQQLASVEGEVEVMREHKKNTATVEKEKAELKLKTISLEAEVANLTQQSNSLADEVAALDKKYRAAIERKHSAENGLVEVERLKQQVVHLQNANHAYETESHTRLRELEVAASTRSPTPEILHQIERSNSLQVRLETAERQVEVLQSELISKKIEYEYSTKVHGGGGGGGGSDGIEARVLRERLDATTNELNETKVALLDRKLEQVRSTSRELRSHHSMTATPSKGRGVSPVRNAAPFVGSPIGEYPRLFNVSQGDELDMKLLQNRPHPNDLLRHRPSTTISASSAPIRLPAPQQLPPRLQSAVVTTPSQGRSEGDTVTVPRRYLESVYHNTNLSRRYWQHKMKEEKK